MDKFVRQEKYTGHGPKLLAHQKEKKALGSGLTLGLEALERRPWWGAGEAGPARAMTHAHTTRVGRAVALLEPKQSHGGGGSL